MILKTLAPYRVLHLVTRPYHRVKKINNMSLWSFTFDISILNIFIIFRGITTSS